MFRRGAMYFGIGRAKSGPAGAARDGDEALIEDAEGGVDSLARDEKRRAEPDAVLSAAEQQEPALERLLDDAVAQGAVLGVPRGAGLDDLDRLHQADAARVADHRVSVLAAREARGQVLPLAARVFHVAVFDQLDRLQGRRARDGVAAEGGSVGAGGPVHQV